MPERCWQLWAERCRQVNTGQPVAAVLRCHFGRILIDGHDIRDLTLASLRRQVGQVTQETILFNDTVRHNIAYGQPDVKHALVEQAARNALAHDFIMRMPQGFDTVIGEKGFRLSGGERQRIAIARAILKNSPILILDEATSALDAESESLVQIALANLMQGRTVVVIAHPTFGLSGAPIASQCLRTDALRRSPATRNC